MKIPTAARVLSVLGSQDKARRCEDNTSQNSKKVHVIEEEHAEENTPQQTKHNSSEGITPAEHTKKVPLCEDVPDCQVKIGQGLKEAEEARLIQFLCNNQDVFAWSTSNLKGISRNVMEHVLRKSPKARPVRQKLRPMSEE